MFKNDQFIKYPLVVYIVNTLLEVSDDSSSY